MINRGITYCFLLLFLYFTGCASSGRRFYSGEPQPTKNVAIVYASGECILNSISEMENPKKDLVGCSLFELLPGNYVLDVGYANSGTYVNSFGKSVNLPILAEPGHIYFIYAEFLAANAWQPSIIDIADNDYSKLKKKNYDFSPNLLKKVITHYIQGERKIIQKEESNGINFWR